MAYQPFADPSLFITAPNGLPIPKAYAGSFQLPEVPPVGPPPTFDPGEIPPPPELAPAPVVAPPNAAAAFQNASRKFNAPGPALGDGTVNPFPAEPAPPPPAAPARPQNGTEIQQGALADRQRIVNEIGEVESEGARKKADALDQQVIDEDRAEKDRAAMREREQKEIQYARAQQAQAMDAYVNHKVDQNRLWHSLGTGKKIMAGIGVALAGIGSAFSARAGRAVSPTNPALDIIQKAIDDDVRLQMADRDRLSRAAGMKRDAVGDLTAQFKDRESQYDAIRAGNRLRVKAQFEAIAARTEDQTKKLQAQEKAAELGQSAGVILDQAQQRELENRRAQQSLDLQKRGLGLQGAGLQLNRDQFEWSKGWKAAEFAQDNMQSVLTAQKNALAANKGMSKEEREAAKDALDRESKISERTVFGPDGEKLEPLHGGSFSVADPERARELQKTMTNGTKMIRMADELVRLRDKYGWSSDLAKSPEFQKMRQIYSEMQLTEKDVKQLGALSGSDMGMITGVLGTDDPTGMRDPTEGVRAFRHGMVSALDDDARLAGVKFDARKSFPELSKPGVEEVTKNTPIGALNKAAYATAAPGSYEQFKANADALARGKPNLTNKPAPSGGSATAAMMLVAPAAAGDEKAKQALQVMASSGSPEIRKLIKDIAEANPSLGIKVGK